MNVCLSGKGVILVVTLMLHSAESIADDRVDNLSYAVVQTTRSLGSQLLLARHLVGKQREDWIKVTVEQIDLLGKMLFDEKSRILQTETYAGNDLYNSLTSQVNGLQHMFFDTFGKLKSLSELDDTVLIKAANDLSYISSELKKICTLQQANKTKRQ